MHNCDQPQAPRVGISRCLLREKVRFDGGHKHDALITEILGRVFQWVPVCPEVEIGLGTPRESLHLIGTPSKPRMIASRSKTDVTEAMRRFAAERLEELARIGLHGYILKKDSPSCGLERVRVYREDGIPRRKGQGLFADALIKRFPLLPIEEEDRLHDVRLRENFIERIFAYHRWAELLAMNPALQDLVRFHTRHKLTLLSHSRELYQKLQRLVARAGKVPMEDLLRAYGVMFMASLKVTATPRRHTEVLHRLTRRNSCSGTATHWQASLEEAPGQEPL